MVEMILTTDAPVAGRGKKMFHNTNPTQKNVLAIDDDVVMLVDSKEQASKLYNSVPSIEESCFGAICLMAPEKSWMNKMPGNGF